MQKWQNNFIDIKLIVWQWCNYYYVKTQAIDSSWQQIHRNPHCLVFFGLNSLIFLSQSILNTDTHTAVPI